jgi:excisionase family DNA binding protein
MARDSSTSRGRSGAARGGEPPEIMDVTEAAAFLHVTVATVRAQLAARRLPGKRIGKEWRLSRTALIQWLSEPGEPKNYTKHRAAGD